MQSLPHPALCPQPIRKAPESLPTPQMLPLAVSWVSQGANWEPNVVFYDPAKICAVIHGPQTDCGVSHAAVSWHQVARHYLYRPRLGRWSIQPTKNCPLGLIIFLNF